MKFFSDLIEIFKNSDYRTYIFEGFLHTIIITLLSVLIGLVLGFIVSIIKILSKNNKALFIPNLICEIYTTVIRGTPVALQLFVFVYALFAIPGFKIYAVILCFGINSGAYVSESIRAGIMSVPKGQTEGGLSLGLSNIQVMRKIVLPQAIKNVIPAIGNEVIALLKETAIISMVGSTVGTIMFDLNASASVISFKMADFLTPSLVIALFYLIIVMLITHLIKIFERKMAVSDRDKRHIQKVFG